MGMSKRIQELLQQTRGELTRNWDIDEGMPTAIMEELAYSRLLWALHAEDTDALAWLTFFIARRGYSCWVANTDDPRVGRQLEMLSDYVLYGTNPDWQKLQNHVPSPYNDCRYSDTQSASDSVAYAAKYIHQRSPELAVYCASSADVAYDHILVDHQFRLWFLDIALPVALEKREMSASEREAYRPGSEIQPR